MRFNMKKVKDYISPVFEHKLGDSGRGIAGFTLHQYGEPFANHIRVYTDETRKVVLEEVHRLRNELLNTGDLTTIMSSEEISL